MSSLKYHWMKHKRPQLPEGSVHVSERYLITSPHDYFK